MIRHILLCLLFVTAFCNSQSIEAAAPTVTSLFPPGGQKGKATEVKINGTVDAKTKIAANHEGFDIKLNEKADGFTITANESVQQGVYWLRFWNDEGAAPLKPFVVGNLAELKEAEPNNKRTQSQKLEASTIVNGVLQSSGDVDIYAIEMKKGQTLVASMMANSVLESPMDGILQVLAPRGFVLEQNDDDQSFDPEVIYTATEDGVHYVRAFGFPAKPNSSVRFAGGATYIYRLTITVGPFIDHTFPLAVKRGSESNVSLIGWNIGDEIRSLKIPADAAGESFLFEHPAISNHSSILLTDAEVLVEKEPNSREKPAAITLPTAVSGRLDERGDTDVFQFNAKKGERWIFRVESRGLGLPTDPVMTITKEDGSVIKTAETRSAQAIDEKLTQPFSADGAYHVEIRDLHRRGGERFAYRLTVEPEEPGFSLSVAADSFKLEQDKPLEIPVTVTRVSFNEEIEVRAVDLPEGIEVAPVKSEKKGATNKSVKLTLKAKQPTTFSGEFHIVGKALVEKPFERTAQTTTSSKTDALWLTLPPKPAK